MVKDKPEPPADVDSKLLLDKVENLQEPGYSEAAFLLVWRVLEIGLRNHANKENVELDKDPADYVVGK